MASCFLHDERALRGLARSERRTMGVSIQEPSGAIGRRRHVPLRQRAGHYRVDGMLAGAEARMQSYAYAMFFMSDAATHKLRSADGWDIGADPKIVVVDAGAEKERSTPTVHADVYGFVFNPKGRMGDHRSRARSAEQRDEFSGGS